MLTKELLVASYANDKVPGELKRKEELLSLVKVEISPLLHVDPRFV